MEGARGGQPRIRIPPYIFSISLILQSTDIRIIMEESSSLGNNKGVQNSIDQLPDEVLISIVSLLPVKEAARTSVLARRWRCLWKFSRILDFDGSEMVRKLEIRRKILEIERMEFVELVNRVIDMHLSETIDEFRILFDLDSSNAQDINRWITFAFSKNVRMMELNLTPTYTGSFQNMQYTFPNICQPNASLLVSLCLTQICVTGDVLEFFISNCQFLEELRLTNVEGFSSLRPNVKAIRLRMLEIVTCPDFTRLEISSPNLESFSFSACSRNDTIIALDDVSSLIYLSLEAHTPTRLSSYLLGFSGCLSRLETLMLHTNTTEDEEELEFPNLPRLKKLVFTVGALPGGSILCLTPLINAARMLHELVLQLKWDTSFNHQRPARCSDKRQTHQCLKVFKIEGFALRAVAAEVALYVLENADSLEQMIIYGKAVTGKDLVLLKANLQPENYAQGITRSVVII